MRIVRSLALSALALAAAASARGDIRTIDGARRRVDVASQHVDGRYLLVSFKAAWCPGCRQAEPTIRGLVARNPNDVTLRMIDIGNWDSPSARQHGIQQIPWLFLYDRSGKRVRTGPPDKVLGTLRSRLASDAKKPAEQPPASAGTTADTPPLAAATPAPTGPDYGSAIGVGVVFSAATGLACVVLLRRRRDDFVPRRRRGTRNRPSSRGRLATSDTRSAARRRGSSP